MSCLVRGPKWNSWLIQGVRWLFYFDVFERMCVADPRFRRRLHLCGWRLVLGDSSPLMVRCELCNLGRSESDPGRLGSSDGIRQPVSPVVTALVLWQLARRCWPLSRCALTFVNTSVVINLPYAHTTGLYGGSRSFAIIMACWPDGICSQDSSLWPSNTDQGPSTLMLMAFPGSVTSISPLIVQWDRRTSLSSKPALPWLWLTNLLPSLWWVIPWIWTCSRRCPVRFGWPQSTWTRSPVIWPRMTLILLGLLHILRIQLWRSFGTG